MSFFKLVRVPKFDQAKTTDAIVREAILLCGGKGDEARNSDGLSTILPDADDIYDVVRLLKRSMGIRPTRAELSQLSTLADLVALFDRYRRANK